MTKSKDYIDDGLVDISDDEFDEVVEEEIPPIVTQHETAEGVYFHEGKKKFGKRILRDGVVTHVGYFATAEEADAFGE